jgi:hypothetical protein
VKPSSCGSDSSQSAVFDAAQAVRALARLHGAPLAGLVDESDWDLILSWQPAQLEWSASLHAAYLADMLDRFGDRLAQLAQHASARQPDAVKVSDNSGHGDVDVVARLSKGAERLARLLEGWSMGPDGVADLVMMTLAEEVTRDGSYHLSVAQQTLDQAATSFLGAA